MAEVVACISWVPRGAAKEMPEHAKLDEDKLKELLAQAEGDLAAATTGDRGGEGNSDEDDEWETEDEEDEDDGEDDDAMGDAIGVAKSDAELRDRYNLDAYDDDDEETSAASASGTGGLGALGNGLAGLVYHGSNSDDPYITVPDDADNDDEDDEDMRVRPDDNLVVAGQTEDLYSSLAVSVFDERDDHVFAHHEIMLPSYPLCMEWLDFDPEAETPGNLLAVGTMSPNIEFWDLDIVDCVEPAFTLEGNAGDGGAGRKKKRVAASTASETTGHSAEILALSWNRAQRDLLASGSADATVKLWDLSAQKVVRTYTHHTDKVSSAEWNPVEPSVLLTGSFDRTAQVFDARSPKAVAQWRFGADVECLIWNPFEPHLFLASTEEGFVYAGDTRRPGETLFTLQAHELTVTSLSFSRFVPGLMVTASIDKTVKVWDVHGGKPSFVAGRELDKGALYTVSFSPDSPGVLAAGGMAKGITCIDVFDIAAVKRAFSQRAVKEQPRPVEKRAAAAADAPDDTVVYAAEEDEAEGKEDSWLDIMKDLHIEPSNAGSGSKKLAPKGQGKGKGKGKNKGKGKKKK